MSQKKKTVNQANENKKNTSKETRTKNPLKTIFKKRENETENTIFMKVFLLVFSIVFTLIVLGILFYNKTILNAATTKNNIIGFLIGMIVFPLLFFIINNKYKENKKKLIIFYVISYILFLGLQITILYYTQNKPGWDWQIVYESALNYVKGNTQDVNFSYFSNFPNNKYLFIFEVIFFKILNIFGLLQHSLIALRIVNIILVNIAGVLTVLTIRKIFGNKLSIYGTILVILSSAFYIYLPIFYSDTVTMPIPIAIIYTYLCFDRKDNKFIFNKKNIILLGIMGFLVAIGIKLKVTCLIAFLGIVADIIFNRRLHLHKKELSCIVVAILAFLLLFKIPESRLTFFQNTKQGALPYTHWVMMGLFERPSSVEGKNHIGAYDADLYSFTFKQGTKENMIKANIKKSIEKLKEYGPINYIHFLYRKMLFTLGDGTFSGCLVITENPLMKFNFFHQLLFEGREYFEYYYIKDIAVLLFIYVSLIVGAIHSLIVNKDINNKFYITIFGLLAFLLIWETTPRYIVHYFPIIIVACVPGVQVIVDKLNHLLKKVNKVA